jgi:hypothetical protein
VKIQRFIFLFIFFAICFAKASDISSAGEFTVSLADSGFQPTSKQVSWLREHLRTLQGKYPKLVQQVLANGYQKIVFEKSPRGKLQLVAFAQLQKDSKKIIIYERLLQTANESELNKLSYSFAQVVLLHELLHGYDERSKLVVNNLKIVGWDVQEKKSTGFRISSLPWIENLWISHRRAVEIAKSTARPSIGGGAGVWVTHLRAAKEARAFGYPTIYSIVGGPMESFAELGAYIALDPEAESYVPVQTLRWFRENILR